MKTEKLPSSEHMVDMLTFGESFMDGEWEVAELEDFLYDMSRNRIFQKMMRPRRIDEQPVNLQSPERSMDVIERHYDLGNDVFEAMLGSTMSYTCAFWRDAYTLDEAQEAKMDRVIEKLEIQDGDRVLDLGCGFGALAKRIKMRYDATVVGYTLSAEQAKLAREHCDEVFVEDYRNAKGKFDKIVSLGLLEHVGYMNYRSYMKTVWKCLEPNGVTLLQTIGHNVSHKVNNPWINKYIFPNGMLPSLTQISEASERLFVIEDVENFGPDYGETCRAWYQRLEQNWPSLSGKYSERFFRMMRFWLLFSVAGFRNREFQLYQVVMTKRRLWQPKRVC